MKISYTLIKKMLDNNIKCTNTDFLLVFYLAKFQFDNGNIPCIYYQDVLKDLNIHKSTYYRSLHRLSSYGILSWDIVDHSYGYHSITLHDNDFTMTDAYNRAGYINIDFPTFNCDSWKTIKLSARKIFLEIYMQCSSRSKKEGPLNRSDESLAKYANISVKNKKLLSELKEILLNFNINKETLIDLVIIPTKKSVKNFFLLKKVKDKYKGLTEEDLKSNNPNLENSKSEKAIRQRYNFEVYCRRNKIEYSQDDIDSLCIMDNEYKDYNKNYKQIVLDTLNQYGEVKCSLIRHKMKAYIQTVSEYYYGELNITYTPLI